MPTGSAPESPLQRAAQAARSTRTGTENDDENHKSTCETDLLTRKVFGSDHPSKGCQTNRLVLGSDFGSCCAESEQRFLRLDRLFLIILFDICRAPPCTVHITFPCTISFAFMKVYNFKKHITFLSHTLITEFTGPESDREWDAPLDLWPSLLPLQKVTRARAAIVRSQGT